MENREARAAASRSLQAARLALPAACLALVTFGQTAAQRASGPSTVTYTVEDLAFDAADTNNDGLVSEAELTRDAAVAFATLDKDGSMTLTAAELGPHDTVLFERIDVNKDGVLTFAEVMTNKVRAFQQGDENKDGGLSFEEMVKIVEVEVGGAS